MLEQECKSSKKYFGYLFLTFLLWNILTTYWIWNASEVGMIIAVCLNALLMAIPFILFRSTKNKLGERAGFIAFIAYWISYEYFHLSWDFSWPWLTLGNGFSENTTWVQWYEYTGVFGGSLWILSSNILAYKAINKVIKNQSLKFARQEFINLALVVLLPLLFSKWMYFQYKEKSNPTNVVVVQPNIDPYHEKFESMSTDAQVDVLIKLSDSFAQANTEFFIWPETAIGDLYEETFLNASSIMKIKKFLDRYKNGNVLCGATTIKQYESPETVTARKFQNGACCYDVFNSALLIENSPLIQVYHKSKLVPGVEQIPYPYLFKFLEPLTIKLGGAFGSLGKQKDRTVFYSQFGIGVAPIICYESVYGEFISRYVKNGAQMLAIITNDGWWGNTPGYKQHASYARLRAIETRRDIARSANTGISCFIDQRGDMPVETSWWKKEVIKRDLNLNDRITFYVKYGDVIAKAAAFLSCLLLLLTFIPVNILKKN